ncbi:Farnesyl diphosphate synthase [Arsenophonus endosymbiont of Aleurodicus floccissimus]|uniref:(2E,6E)-farnesyl diphosphate synthase n=1 Tax=Arsenophonus endosymbiont of Aleurodicus floccissimus TaxID=2152761 RepID=UPI000E6B2D77|nr:(2E,6E)-farnesyl diphosphate synthase [Arsenophonus endosymbiont of Aleurodicus floccissimus]SPP32350.1 Farnesyl diphosphate synthase [Arsenophonus endosymbiont of Aleurodicus floccissimus]
MSEIVTLSFADQHQWVQDRVNKTLLKQFKSLPVNQSQLVTAMKYGTLLGGKRLRPFLVYAIGDMLNVAVENLDVPAVAVECIHAYSLIHDDLPAMDNDNLRRGQPTCHISFGEAHAILAGDALQTLAFDILSRSAMPDISDTNRLAMIAELATASGAAGMCGGQALDMESEGQQIDIATLESIHHHKTGALIRAAIRMSAFSAGSQNYKLLPLLDNYANAIGLLFQVHDDILDVTGDTDTLGKNQGSDEKHKKSTYPSLIGVEQAQKKANNLSKQALDALYMLEQQYGLNTETLQNLTHFIIERKS